MFIKIKNEGAKLEAYSMVDKYFKLSYLSINQSKECALIAVEDIINLIDGFDLERTYLYYQEVKEEIIKLKY